MARAARRPSACAAPVAVLYATESMRLTTRLLDLASWLLIRRALKEGEITREEAQKKRERVKLQAPGRPSHVKGFAELPQGLRDLIEESFALHDRIVQLDRAMSVKVDDVGAAPSRSHNPVGAQVDRLRTSPSRKLQQRARRIANCRNRKSPADRPGFSIRYASRRAAALRTCLRTSS